MGAKFDLLEEIDMTTTLHIGKDRPPMKSVEFCTCFCNFACIFMSLHLSLDFIVIHMCVHMSVNVKILFYLYFQSYVHVRLCCHLRVIPLMRDDLCVWENVSDTRISTALD